MNLDVNNQSASLSRTIRTCGKLSTLCLIAFVIIVLWIFVVLTVLTISIIRSSTDSSLLLTALPMLSAYALYGINFSLIPLILGRMLRDISTEGTPFTLRNSNRLRGLSLILVVYSILEAILAFADSQFNVYVESWDIGVGSFVRDFSSNAATTLDLFPLVIAAVFFALSYVFKYGVLLQQESDETL